MSYDLNSKCISHYKFEETSGTTVIDSKNYRNGNLSTRDMSFITTTGKINKGLILNSVAEDYINFTPHREVVPLALDCWFKLTELPSVLSAETGIYVATVYFLGWRTGWGLYVDTDDKVTFYAMETPAPHTTFTVKSNNVILKNVWYHVVINLDSTCNMTMYLNRIKQTATNNCINLDVRSDTFSIGWFDTAMWDYHVGNFTIDEMSIYNNILSQTEVDARYNAGIGTHSLPTIVDSLIFGAM